MSSVSQTPARSRFGFAPRFALAMAVVAALIAVALGPVGGYLVREAATARLHGPDLALFASMPIAIKIHLIAALAALVLGGVLMAVRKGRLFHRVAGWVWVSLVSVTAGATLFITTLNHGKLGLLHLFTGWVLLILPLAVMAAKRHDVVKHRGRMMGLFYGGFAINLFIAFIPGRLMWMMFFG
jgi:uncharacterized membrane protein